MSDVNKILVDLEKCLTVIMNDNCTSVERQMASTTIEKFKCESPLPTILQVSSHAIKNPNSSPVIKHFAFQLLECVVKFNWNQMNTKTRQELKFLLENVFDTYNSESFGPRYLKDAISRCFVEVMKRDWPQCWPTIFPKLLSKGNCDLVLYVLWRLAEDLGVFYLPQNAQRRREMHNELVSNLNDILIYICNALVSGDFNLCLSSLNALTGFLEWSSIDVELLKFLCDLLDAELPNCDQQQIKLLICDCLLLCLNRKGVKAEDRKALLSLFQPNCFNPIFNFTK